MGVGIEPRGLALLTLDVPAAGRVQVGLSRFASGIKNWRPFFEGYVAPMFFGDIQDNFDSQGAAAGGWAALSPAYAAWKAKRYPGRPILQRDGELKTSLSWKGAMFAATGGSVGYKGIARFAERSAELGTSVPYAGYHQLGTDRMKQRRLIVFTPDAASRYGKAMHRWAYDVWNNSGLTPSDKLAQLGTGRFL